MRTNPGIRIENDNFMLELRDYSNKNNQVVFVGGISAITRLFNFPPPETEILVFVSEENIDLFTKGRSCFFVKCSPFPDHKVCCFGEKSCHLLVTQSFNESLCLDIESIIIDSITLNMFDTSNGIAFNALDNGYIKPTKKGCTILEYFWKAMETIGYFSNFNIDLSQVNTLAMFPIKYKMNGSLMTGEWVPSAGQRIITNALMNMVELPYFAFYNLRDNLKLLLGNIHVMPDVYLNDSQATYDNLMANMGSFSGDYSPVIKLAVLFCPLISWEGNDYNTVTSFLRRVVKPPDYDALMKMNIIDNNKSPLLFWFLHAYYCFETPLASDIISVLYAWRMLSVKMSCDQWAFIYGGKYWKEILAMTNPSSFMWSMDEITRSHGAIEVLNKGFKYSNNDIAKARGFNNMYKVDINRVKSEFFEFLKRNPNATLEDFAAHFQQRR